MTTEETSTPLALPTPSANNADTQKVQLDSEQISSLKFDSLGPMIVNSDGVSTSISLSIPYLMLIVYGTLQTLSRITNWETMTEGERERTMRVLNARNR